jgi:L-amino acid N-acyltransferase YncA
MRHSFILRPATLADAPAILAIYGPQVIHGTASWEYTPPDLAEMERRMNAILAAGYPYLVAEVGNELAGYCYASSYRPREGYRYVVEDSIYVDPRFQGRGIGRGLLHTLIEECTARGFRQMVAIIGDSENAGSIALHQACGFYHVGTLVGIGFKHGRWLDSVLMQRGLQS